LSATLASPPSWREEYLQFEYSASRQYYDFIYDNRAEADSLRTALFDSGGAEYSAAHGKVFVVDGRACGMIACLTAGELRKCRIKSAYSAVRFDIFAGKEALMDRFHLAGRALMQLQARDYYLSRIAAIPGSGHAGHMLSYCVAQARAANADRICLEVATSNARAIAFYRKHGFELVNRCLVEDAVTGRTLDYAHMARPI